MPWMLADGGSFVVGPEATLWLRDLAQTGGATAPSAVHRGYAGVLRLVDSGTTAKCRRDRQAARFVVPQSGIDQKRTLTLPYASRGAFELYYESTGAGTPVLLINGQAMTLSTWWRTVPVLAGSFRVLTFDQRDMGRSGHSPWPYSVAQMAADAIAVLDAADVERAHVYGVSLGGMVAQEVALMHPDRVEALVLGATTAGGPGTILARPEPLGFFVRAGAMGPEEAEWAAVPYNYAEATRREHGDRIAEDIARRVLDTTDALGYIHQVGAAAGHNTVGRLHEIAAPTLVVHGEDDVVIPPSNGRLLAQAIPGAKLKVWPGAGHLFMTDEPRADRHIASFLTRHTLSAARGGRAA